MHPGTYKTNSMSIAVACSAENMQNLDVAGACVYFKPHFPWWSIDFPHFLKAFIFSFMLLVFYKDSKSHAAQEGPWDSKSKIYVFIEEKHIKDL